MPEQAVVVELAEGLEPNFLPLSRHFEDAVHLQCVGGVCDTVCVADILLKQLVLISVFVKGLQRERDGTSTMAQVSQHTHTHTHAHAHAHAHTHTHTYTEKHAYIFLKTHTQYLN